MDLIAAPSTQNDYIVDPHGGLAIGSCGLPFNGLDAHPFPVAVVEIQRTDDLLGAGEIVLMVQLRRPGSRTGVVDDQQQPARADGARGVPEDPRPIERNHGMQKLRGNQIEGAVRKAVGQVVLGELDAITQPPGVSCRSTGVCHTCAMSCQT